MCVVKERLFSESVEKMQPYGIQQSPKGGRGGGDVQASQRHIWGQKKKS